MTRQMSALTAIAVSGLLAGAAQSGSARVAAAPQDDHAAHAAAQPAPPATPDMMKMHGQMMADMKVEAARLDVLVKEMNAASGTAKTDAIAAVVNELVRQRTAMQAHMGGMHDMMMRAHTAPAKP
jgi:hypothetical protein